MITDGQDGFDPEALRERYRAERDKRLRADGSAQYTWIEGDHAHFTQDPLADPAFHRDPLTDEVEVLIVGGGYSGLLVGARLRQQGIESIRIIDRGGEFGGCWYWNRYPGIACDVEAYTYMPLLEETGFMPSHRYASGAEIREHCRAIARTFDLDRDACFRTSVTGMTWDEAAQRWTVTTDRGDAIRARFVAVANFASLNRPKLPGVPGIADFAGPAFHTSRWDYAVTGGGPEGGLDKLADKVVGVIGTGASAVQVIPHLAAGAKHLHVFQRTPASIDFRDDRPTDPAWAASLTPGWQRRRIENFTVLTSGGYAEEDLVQDSLTRSVATVNATFRRMRLAGEDVGDRKTFRQMADFRKMEAIRARVEAEVANPVWAEQLKPWYDQFCKRPCFHDAYLATFNRPNVSLVDTDGKGVERITATGVIANGREYPLDVLVYASGFEVLGSFQRRIGYPITGRGGAELTAKWTPSAATFHGMFSHGFPNCFIMTLTQSGRTFNNVHLLDEIARHIGHVVGECARRGLATVEATQEAEDAWVAEIDRRAPAQEEFMRECTPSYSNFEGDIAAFNPRNMPYGGGPVAFFDILAEWRAEGTLRGLATTALPG
ncbi:flavin-containing monooxygenase [Novosphingobium bradum]|uniref:Flavin-containing monooxygenase n=1 Tax=Novosphingobium bradum TaxID=1737444 RepID=A0ABV7IKN1_9SPHN